MPLLKNPASEDTGGSQTLQGCLRLDLEAQQTGTIPKNTLKTPLKMSLLPPLDTPGVSLVWSLEPTHPLPHCSLWSQRPPPPSAQLPRRLARLVDGTLPTGPNPDARKKDKCPGAFTPPDKEVGRLCLQLRLEAEFPELVTTTVASKRKRKVEQSCSVSFFEGVRSENLGPSEDGEEGIIQDGEPRRIGAPDGTEVKRG